MRFEANEEGASHARGPCIPTPPPAAADLLRLATARWFDSALPRNPGGMHLSRTQLAAVGRWTFILRGVPDLLDVYLVTRPAREPRKKWYDGLPRHVEKDYED